MTLIYKLYNLNPSQELFEPFFYYMKNTNFIGYCYPNGQTHMYIEKFHRQNADQNPQFSFILSLTTYLLQTIFHRGGG